MFKVGRPSILGKIYRTADMRRFLCYYQIAAAQEKIFTDLL